MSVKMTRYKPAEFADEDTSSVGSIQLNETHSSPGLHLRYHASRSPSFWRTRNILEKSLIIIILVLLALLIILTCLIVRASKPRNLKLPAALIAEAETLQPAPIKYLTDESNICVTENCIHAASNILRSIDRSVQPCDDFYAYACNQWIRNNPIPDGKSLWGTFGKLEQQNHVVVKNVLERAVFKSNAEKKAKLYYQSCLDDDESLEKLGGEPMKKLIRSIGGWNVTDSGFNISCWTLQQSLQMVQNRFNMGGLFSWAVGEDDRNSSRHVIQIDQGGLTLPTREHYLNKTAHEKVLTAYLDYMSKVGVLLGAEKGESEKQMADIITFETKLADISTPSEDRRDEEELYHSMTISELQERAPFINWQAHFNDALIIVQKNISENEKLVIYAPEYLEKLTRVIWEYNSTEHGKIVLNNYLVWQTVRSLTACLSKSFRDAYKGLRKALIGSEGGEEPWRYCVTDTNNVLGFAVGAMFVREVFHGEAKPLAEEMIDEVRRAFKLNLPNLNWMDQQTRKLADEKADAISDMIGFPDYILNPKELDNKYKDLEVDPKEYFQNNVRVYIFNLKKNLEKLDQSVNRTKWGMTPLTVNAYYTPTKNQIVFPAGILQLPFYDRKNPKSLNFGAIGVVMGHELTHAFDDQGREYDKEGNMHQWWNNKTIERFKNRTSCFEKQYSGYKINGRSLNGFQTLGENIADNGGLKAAFHAFTKSKAVSDVDRLPLPGLNLTHRQLFFVSFAQVWCSAVTDETTNLQIEKDPHAPPKFRVIGPLSNLKEFSEEFKCIPGTPMNPHKKCEVW